MKKQLLAGVLSLLAASVMAADSGKDEVVKAAKKLAGNSYSWKSTSETAGGGGGGGGGGGQFRAGPTEGKADKDGTVHLTTSRGDNNYEAVIGKGGKGAVKAEGSWKTVEEASESSGDGGNRNPTRTIARMAQTFKAPAAQAEELAGKAKELKKEGDVISGDLSEEATKALMAFGGRGGNNAPEVSGAKGKVKFWVKDGNLTKYEYNVKGTMSFNGNDRDIDRTTTVEIKDVGTTKLTVPDEAKKKIS